MKLPKGVFVLKRVACLSIPILMLAPTLARATETITYVYDARGRVVTVVHSGTVNNGVTTTYTVDKNGNRTNVTTTGAP